MRILALLFGIILLLPGLCSLGFMAFLLPDMARDPGGAAPFVLLWLVCFAISFGGIVIIRRAIQGTAPR